MIAFDTNALVRMLVEDDVQQAKIIEGIVNQVEQNREKIMILPEVLIETVWVLESVYQCNREEIHSFLDNLLGTAVFVVNDPTAIRSAIVQYKQGGDFADLIIVNQSKRVQAKKLISFDRKLQKRFPGYVVESF